MKLLLIFITLKCRDFKTIGGESEFAQLFTQKKNAFVRLKLEKPRVKYGDYLLCRVERMTEIASV